MENCCNYFFRETQTNKVDKTKQNKTKSNDELSVIASKTREALMLLLHLLVLAMFCTGDQSQLCHITQHFKKSNFSSEFVLQRCT